MSEVEKSYYNSWSRIKAVCNNKNDSRYPRYGGRGIRCLWKNFSEFKKDMFGSYMQHVVKFGRLNTTIERIDNTYHYCKQNCRWATRKEQAMNRCTRKEVSYMGKTMSVTEWAETLGFPKIALWLRLYRRHWSIEKALTMPLRVRK